MDQEFCSCKPDSRIVPQVDNDIRIVSSCAVGELRVCTTESTANRNPIFVPSLLAVTTRGKELQQSRSRPRLIRERFDKILGFGKYNARQNTEASVLERSFHKVLQTLEYKRPNILPVRRTGILFPRKVDEIKRYDKADLAFF